MFVVQHQHLQALPQLGPFIPMFANVLFYFILFISFSGIYTLRVTALHTDNNDHNK